MAMNGGWGASPIPFGTNGIGNGGNIMVSSDSGMRRVS
jgi:hypothetical protein